MHFIPYLNHKYEEKKNTFPPTKNLPTKETEVIFIVASAYRELFAARLQMYVQQNTQFLLWFNI